MAKRRIILVSVVCLSIVVLTVQTLSQTSSSNQTIKRRDAERLRNMTEEERKKEFEKWRVQRKLERERRRKEFEKRREQQKLEREQRRKVWEKQKQKEEAEGFRNEKWALGATEERWKIIKLKLEKVQSLRSLERSKRSTSGIFRTNSSSSGTSSRGEPTWQWKRTSWKDKAPGELTEGQKMAEELIYLVAKKNTTAEEFIRKMDDLRKCRSREDAENRKKKKELSEAQQELREVLTTRQEAALVLMHWL